MTLIATYTFGAEFIPDAQIKIGKVNARAAKNGVAGYTTSYTVEAVEVEGEPGVFENIATFTVEGDAPKIAGWEFLATMDTDSLGVTVTRLVPGAVESDLTGFRTRVGECDHCKINRQRNSTYIVRNVETGETLQVGSTCLSTFLGMNVSLAFIGETFEANENSDWGFGRGERSFSLHHYLAVVAAVVEREGWVSRSASRY